jgi:hypothetical protein
MSRQKTFDAVDEVSECGEWYAKKMYLVRQYILELEAYIKELEQDYDELSGR